jgi:hypothetical protein
MSDRRATVLTFVVAGVVAGLTLGIIVAAGRTPNVAYVLALAAIGGLIVVALRRAVIDVAPPTWTEPTASARPEGGVDPRIGVIELMLRRSVEDAGICRRRLQPLLFDLATHRLRTRRGIELIEDPERARAALGDDPFQFLTDVVTEPIRASRLERVITAIEQL